jgi:cytoskeletal protein CcmA (bactofilin family)
MIFKKTESDSEAKSINTIIGPSAKFTGDIQLKGSLRVDGYLQGNISGDGVSVIIGKTGVVEGDINARIVFVGGTVKGSVRASEYLEIFSSAEVDGDLQYSKISIEEGANVQGRFIKTPERKGAETSVDAAE